MRYSIRYCFLLLLSLLFIPAAHAQTGKVKGQVTDNATGTAIPLVSIILEQNGVRVQTGSSDMQGNYLLTNIKPGTYTLKAQAIKYRSDMRTGLSVESGKELVVNFSLLSNTPVVVADSSKVSEQQQNKMLITGGKKEMKVGLFASGGTTYNWTPAGDGIDQPMNTEDYKHIDDNGYKLVSKEPLSTFSANVDRASYSNVRRFINGGSLPPPDAVRIEEMINYFKYNYAQPKGDDPFSITMEQSYCPWNPKHRLVHIGLQGKRIETENLPASNLVFLIDVSGSMQSPDKLPLVKASLRLLVNELRPNDRVALVVYAGAAGEVLPSTPGNKKSEILQAIDKLEAGGSTAGGEGINLAYKVARKNFMEKGNNRVILCTDGDFNVGVSSDGDLTRLVEEKRKDGVFLTVLGYGTGNYKDSKMETLADKGNGNYAYIDNLQEANKTLVTEMGGTLLTIAKDVKIQVEFNPAKVKAFRLVGYENRILNHEDFNNDKKDAGEIGAGHTVTALYEIIPAGSDEVVGNIDPLKYQQATAVSPSAAATDEMLTIKFRYKKPSGDDKSILITRTLADDKGAGTGITSDDFRFASAVASFGMLLRNSEFKGDASYDKVLELARGAKGKDDEGYRAEFIRLVEAAKLLKQSAAATD
jgi:Ca-activated chloride channel family protein